jgi:hypothetical protein
MQDIAQVFRTLWERAGEFNSVPILTPKVIPLGDYGRITNRNLLVRIAHASRVSDEAVSGSRTFTTVSTTLKTVSARRGNQQARRARYPERWRAYRRRRLDSAAVLHYQSP